MSAPMDTGGPNPLRALRGWLFTPVDTAPMAALRIACGLLTLGWALSYLPDATTFLADDGLTAAAVQGTRGWWTLPVPAPLLMVALLAVVGVALALGWHTRLAAVLAAFGLIWLQRRDVYVLNSGDLLLRELALYLVLMPAGEVCSLDARRRRRRGHDPAPRAPFGLRLLQLQVSCLYLFSVIAKLQGTTWHEGTAVGEALQLEDLQRLRVPFTLASSLAVSGVMTYATLVVEASLVLGLWFRRTRYPVMAAGVLVHLGIEATLLIGWFSLTVIACYLAFVPGPDLRRAVRWGRQRLGSPQPASHSVALSASTPSEPPASSQPS